VLKLSTFNVSPIEISQRTQAAKGAGVGGGEGEM
jgi:hypothetical protein